MYKVVPPTLPTNPRKAARKTSASKAAVRKAALESRPRMEHEICTRGCASSVIAFERGCNLVHL